MEKKTNSHGGARANAGGFREGAGRKSFSDKGTGEIAKTSVVNVRLTDDEKEHAVLIGDGSASAGIRLALSAYKLKK
jgi:hypothetical protein